MATLLLQNTPTITTSLLSLISPPPFILPPPPPPLYLPRHSLNLIYSFRYNCTALSAGGVVGRRQQLSYAKQNSTFTCRCSSSKANEAIMIELPCLPFSPVEVFTPSSSKTLHLYEARFLALLDEVLGRYNNFFAHIVLERIAGENLGLSQTVSSFAATYGCLACVESVRKTEVGALVTVRGIGRINFLEVTQVEPFLKGKVSPFQDDIPDDIEGMSSLTTRLKHILTDVQRLQIKLKTSDSDLLQTPLERAMQWAEKNSQEHNLKQFVPRREELISFAALQPVAGASAGELHKLLQERLLAMELTDTLRRLKNVCTLAEENRASIAAKVAIQSLQL